jgi:hypothetical protein
LNAEIEALRAEQRQIEHQFSAAFRRNDFSAERELQPRRQAIQKLIEAKQRELQGLLEQQKEEAATPR